MNAPILANSLPQPTPKEKLTLQPYRVPRNGLAHIGLRVFRCLFLILALILMFCGSGEEAGDAFAILSALAVLCWYFTCVMWVLNAPTGWCIYKDGKSFSLIAVSPDDYRTGKVAMFATMPLCSRFIFSALTNDGYQVTIPIDFTVQAFNVANLGRYGGSFEQDLANTFSGPIANRIRKVSYHDTCAMISSNLLIDSAMFKRSRVFSKQHGVVLQSAYVHSPQWDCKKKTLRRTE
ncbi:hypothetical protein ACFL34_05625 [Candidatus Sumerlaeota bacterium]